MRRVFYVVIKRELFRGVSISRQVAAVINLARRQPPVAARIVFFNVLSNSQSRCLYVKRNIFRRVAFKPCRNLEIALNYTRPLNFREKSRIRNTCQFPTYSFYGRVYGRLNGVRGAFSQMFILLVNTRRLCRLDY